MPKLRARLLPIAAGVLVLVGSQADARTLIVAADSTEEFVRICDAAVAALPGDSILVRDGVYDDRGGGEETVVLDSAVVLFAEHPGQVQLWAYPLANGIELHGTARMHDMIVVGCWASQWQELAVIYGGSATITNCQFLPFARQGTILRFRSSGHPPVIQHCEMNLPSGANWIAISEDTTVIAMPGLHYRLGGQHWTDTTFLHTLINGPVYISPVADTFYFVGVDERRPQRTREVSVSVWPNPSAGALTLELPGLAPVGEIEIYNLLGQRVWTSPAPPFLPARRLNLVLPLPSGSYFIRVGGEQVRHTATFTILK